MLLDGKVLKSGMISDLQTFLVLLKGSTMLLALLPASATGEYVGG